MRKFLGLLFAGAMVVGVATSSQAGTLGIGGTLSLTIGALPPVALPDNGGATLLVSSGSGAFTEVAGVFGPATIPLSASLFTGVPQISGLTLLSFGNGTKAVSGGVGTGGLAGTALVTVLQSLNLSIPLTVVGQAGATVQAGAGAIIITVVGQGWTTGVAMVTGITSTTAGTNVLNTATLTGSDNRTAGHAGTITLVSGFQAITSVAGTLPGFAIQALTFVPEAGTLVLLGTGAIGLALYGRRRMTK
jgi:hypothetical protein